MPTERLNEEKRGRYPFSHDAFQFRSPVRRKMSPFFLSFIFIFLTAGKTQAQTEPDLPRLEVGIHYTSLHLAALQEWPGGFGGRFGYNLFEYVTLEGEYNYFPVREPKSTGSPAFPAIRSGLSWFGESQVLFGIKAGIRIERFGFFGKVKPGLIYLTDRQNLQNLIDQSRLRFALELGGVFEYCLSPSVALRVDMGETLIDFGRYRAIGDYPSQKTPNRGFQAGVGIVFRF